MNHGYNKEEELLTLVIPDEEIWRTNCILCKKPIDPHTAQYSDKCMSCIEKIKTMRDMIREMVEEHGLL